MTSPRVVFLIGAPRSGTTWLQSLLGSHPAVVTPQETDLFSTFVAPLQDWWDDQIGRSSAEHVARRTKGLPAILDDAEFSRLIETMVERVLAAIRNLDPAASIIVEKSPSHSHHVDLIAKYLPGAAFLHIVRDGRDTAASLQSASRGWGSYWAPGSLKKAAVMWKANVLAARTAAGTGRYAEVRYEDLRAGNPEPLQRAFALCGITCSLDECAALLEDFSLERMTKGDVASPIAVGGGLAHVAERKEPPGFYGKGAVGGWSESWSTQDRLLFDAVAGDLLVELGYEPNSAWAGSAWRRAWYRKRSAVLRAVGKTGRRVGSRLTKRSTRMLNRLP